MTEYFVIAAGEQNDKSYGIRIVKEVIVEDITHSYKAAELLADTCNRAGVELEQFNDILENFMADYETF